VNGFDFTNVKQLCNEGKIPPDVINQAFICLHKSHVLQCAQSYWDGDPDLGDIFDLSKLNQSEYSLDHTILMSAQSYWDGDPDLGDIFDLSKL
jgi:hypothetical protein